MLNICGRLSFDAVSGWLPGGEGQEDAIGIYSQSLSKSCHPFFSSSLCTGSRLSSQEAKQTIVYSPEVLRKPQAQNIPSEFASFSTSF